MKTPAPQRAPGRKKLAAQGQALSDGSYPIPTVDYLKKAIRSVTLTEDTVKPGAPAGTTTPSNSASPSGVEAVTFNLAGASDRMRSPVMRRAGSHTIVTRLCPSSPRETPNQGRISGLT